MAKGMNKAMLLGYVGKDPEVRAAANGLTICNFSLATTERRKEGSEWVDVTEWHSLVAFGRTAEVVRDYVRKGSQLMIEGRIQTRSWDDRESGAKKYRTEIVVNDLFLLGGGEGGGQRGQSSRGGKRDEYDQRGYTDSDQGIVDEDIPF